MSQTHTQSRFVLLVFSLAILAALSGALFWKMLAMRSQPDYQSLIVLPQPKPIADFNLVDENGEDFTLADFKNRWSLLFFGFTSCPDICPNTLFQLQHVKAGLESAGLTDSLPVIYLVSVDPDRDTPVKMAEYLAFFDEEFRGLTGSDAQLRALTMQLGIAYHVEAHNTGEQEYSVDHSASLLIMNPQGELFGVFTAPHDTKKLVHDLQQLLE